MPVAGQPSVAKHLSCSTAFAQSNQCLINLFLIEIHNRITIALLIAARHNSIE